MVGVAGNRYVELVLQRNQSLHGILRRRVHTNSAVPIECHETKGRIYGVVDHFKIQTIALCNRFPIVDACASKRIDSQRYPRAPNGVHIDDIVQVIHIGNQIIVSVRFGGGERLIQRDTL